MPNYETSLENQAGDTRNESLLTQYIVCVEGRGVGHEFVFNEDEFGASEYAYESECKQYDKGEDGVSAHVQLLARDHFKGWVDPTDTILKTNT